MKLLSLKIDRADTCGGMLDGFSITFRDDPVNTNLFEPLCLVGPNGSGKSQLLQIIAEIFQAAIRKYLPDEELGTTNDGLLFELKYLISSIQGSGAPNRVRISRRREGKRKPELVLETCNKDGQWKVVENHSEAALLLPTRIVGYTSGENETLSLPFFASRAGYAAQVSRNALDAAKRSKRISDPRLLLIDYGTNLEVLVANLLLNSQEVQKKLLQTPNLKRLRSFRCVVQLKHAAAPAGGVKVTEELNEYIGFLKRCATCYSHNERDQAFTFDFFVNDASNAAFANYWKEGALELYSCFHKLAMLNDLIIPKTARQRFDRGVKDRRFAARLPEPIDEQKVFRFEQVVFVSGKNGHDVDYVSLSDGEHQLAQILGMSCMAAFPNVLFLLDEPESHFNPRWRKEFIKLMRDFPTARGKRAEDSAVAKQECLITTHSPFLPSDMDSERVLIFSKLNASGGVEVRRPRIQTYGSTFDSILDECFGISPPISDLSREDIEALMRDGSLDEIRDAMKRFGDSVEKLLLADRMRELSRQSEG